MSGQLKIEMISPGATVQDLGRSGFIAQGLSPGGAMDRLALFEAAALLSLDAPVAGVELPGAGGRFTVSQPLRFALTGAPMDARIDEEPILWNASHWVQPGQVLAIGGVKAGSYGYLVPAGGVATEEWQGSRAVHLAAGIGKVLTTGNVLPIGDDPKEDSSALCLPFDDRFHAGVVHLLSGPQSALFPEHTRLQFAKTEFTRTAAANRQGIRLSGRVIPLPNAAKGLVSDFILSGDVQITGDGVPIILMAECQTVGGYPRIGTVRPSDLPKVAQAPIGATLRFKWARPAPETSANLLTRLRAAAQPLVRDPKDMRDLLRYELISGATAGKDHEGG